MKYLLLAATAAAAAVVSAPATAATVVYESGPTVVLTYRPSTNDYDGAFRYRVVNNTPGDPNGDFIAQFSFISPVAGLASSIASNVIVSRNLGSDIDFLNAFINGTPGSVSNFGPGSSAFVFDAPVIQGLNTLTFTGRLNPNGNRVGNGLVTGSLTATAAVPEPAAWALFILGFGGIGGALRQRSKSVRVSKAKLHFS